MPCPRVNFSLSLHSVLTSPLLLTQLDNLFLIKVGGFWGGGLSSSSLIGQLMFVCTNPSLLKCKIWKFMRWNLCFWFSDFIRNRTFWISRVSSWFPESIHPHPHPLCFWPSISHNSVPVSFRNQGDLYNNSAQKINGVGNEHFHCDLCILCTTCYVLIIFFYSFL